MFRHVLICALLAAMPSLATADVVDFTNLIVFGDSLSDTGNVYGNSKLQITIFGGEHYNDKANFPGPTVPPAALTGVPAIDNQLKARWNYTQGRFTDGTDTTPKTNIVGVWHEQLASRMNLGAPKPSSTGGNNYAWGAAETKGGQTPIKFSHSESGVTVSVSVNVDNVGGQVDKFKASLNGGNADPKALYAMWGGGNDLINITDKVKMGQADISKIGETEKTAVSNVKDNIQRLYDLGARCVLWPDMPPLAAIPKYTGLAENISTALSAASTAFKADEEAAIKALQDMDAGLVIMEVDVLGLFKDVMQNPAQFMFDNIDSPARGKDVDPDKYVFWDDVHPTTRTDQLIADAAFKALVDAGKAVPEPASVILLFVSAVFLMTYFHRSFHRVKA